MKTRIDRFMHHPYAKFAKQLALILIALRLTACAPAGPLPIAEGQVLALQPQTTSAGIYAVLNGAEKFGEVWTKNGASVIAWPQSGGWAWACVRVNCSNWAEQFRISAGGQGNLTNQDTWSELATFLKRDGWSRIGPAALTAGQGASGFLQQMAGSITGFMVVPAMPVPDQIQPQNNLN